MRFGDQLCEERANAPLRVSWLLLAWLGIGNLAANLRADIMYSEAVTNDSGTTEYQLSWSAPGFIGGQLSSLTNPFPMGTDSVSYQATSNTTTIVFQAPMGGPGIAANQTVTWGFQYTGSGDSQDSQDGLQVASAAFGAPVTAPIPLLTMGINSSPLDLNTGFILTYATIELANGNTAGEWQELQIPSGPLVPQLVLENDGNANMFAFNVGFQFSNTEIPLDDLNLQDYPPSSFTPVPGLPDNSMSNPTEIAPSSYDVVNLPEPSSIALFALGAAGLALRQLRRR